MKKLRILAASFIVFCAVSTAVFAEEPKNVEAYAHPTMFGSAATVTDTADASYIVGGKIVKSHNRIGIKNKKKVMIESWVKDVMGLLKDKQKGVFNPKMPVLRSELAVILSEGFNLKNTKVKSPYKDITSSYWAKDWVYGATNSGVMIGYPDNTFKPDQPVTKAEVFATIAQLICVPTDRSLIVPPFRGAQIKFIPQWAISPAKEVVASKLLDEIPNPVGINNNEYLSKEQVAYLIATLREDWNFKNTLKKDPNAPLEIKNYKPIVLKVKLVDRLSARHSNIGDKFSAKVVEDINVVGKCFKAGSVAKGEVVEVSRPGLHNPGYIKVKFTALKDDEKCVEFPKNLSQAEAHMIKNPNFVARLFGAPFSATGRVVGVVGRTGGTGVNVASNGLEQLGDNLSNALVDTMSLQPVAGVKNIGNGFVTVGKGVYNLGKLAVSGAFGVLYEVTDEVRYLIVPAYSNCSSLNPGEELFIVF